MKARGWIHKPSYDNVRRIEKIAHHRNGISGVPFNIVLFESKGNGPMMAILWDEPGGCAVLQRDELAKSNIEFANGNSWRGGEFEPELRAAIRAAEDNDQRVRDGDA